MALSKPRTIFGVHSITPYSRTDRAPYGIAQVLQGSTFTLEGSLIELKGGSSRFNWSVEDGDVDATLAFTVSEYPSWLFEIFGGKAPTVGSAETSGNVGSVVNFKGTSIVAATGISTVIVIPSTGAAQLKFGRYIIKATGAAAFKVYTYSDADFGRGTAAVFSDDTLCVYTKTAATASEVINLTEFGLRITMGASTPAMVAGDTAVFEVRPINTFNRSVIIGGLSDTFPEFGCVIFAQKSGSGALVEIDAFKMKAIGMTIGAERKAFGQSEYSAKASYDSDRGGLYELREVE
jgi:hypothetical protein